MTTILISKQHNMVVTDSRGTYTDGGGYVDTFSKVFYYKTNFYAVGSGRLDEIESSIIRLAKDAPIKLKHSTIATVNMDTREVSIYESRPLKIGPITIYRKSIPWLMECNNVAFGSGGHYLWGALQAGMNIESSFRHTFLQDKYSGGSIKRYKL